MARIRSLRGRGVSVTLVVLVALVVGVGAASIVVVLRRSSPVEATGGTHPPGGSTPLPGAGAAVPAYDLASDPVFPTLLDGFAIERHVAGGVVTEHLAKSNDGGATWYLTGSPFPFPSGYAQVQFSSLESGFAFGSAGLAVTHDGGRRWQAGGPLGGTLQKVIPIGDNVWATYAVCDGPPVPTTSCSVNIAISTDDGLVWTHPAGATSLEEAGSGGNILARVTPIKAYVVSYGVTGGNLSLTLDSGTTWQRLPDPSAAYQVVDMAALSGGDLWMICGGAPALGGTASPKAVYRSFDGGHSWTLESSTGFGPASSTGGTADNGAPVGHLAYAGELSQLATISPNRAWIGVTGVGVLVTSDDGRTWELATGVTDDGHDSGVGVTFNNSVDGWAIEFQEGVWRTHDGVHWRLVDGT